MRPRLLCLVPLVLLALPAPTLASNGELLIGREASSPRLLEKTAKEPLLVVIDTPYQVFGGAGTIVHVAAWTPDGRPAAGAEVYLEDHLVGRADGHGTLVFRWGIEGNEVEDYWTGGSRIRVRYQDGPVLRGGEVRFSAMTRTTSFASDHLFVYTDRGIYAPGDTLHARLIGWHLAADYGPIDGAGVELLLLDHRGDLVVGTEVTTDDLGVGAADLEIPGTLEEGAYKLRVAWSGAVASAQVRVERFVPPSLRLEHTLPRFLTRDQERLAWSLELSRFDGAPVGEVSVRADFRVGTQVRHSLRRAVAGPGPHAFEVAPDELAAITDGLGDRQGLEVVLEVVDEQGRADELTRDIVFAFNPYVAVVEADRTAYATGDPVELVVRLTDVQRVPVRERQIELVLSTGERHAAASDASGTAHFSLVMPEGDVDLSVHIDGVEAPLATHRLAWREPQPMRSHAAEAVVRENRSTPIRVEFPAGFRPVEEVVHLDVTDSSGSLVNAFLLPIVERDGVWAAAGEIEAPSWGSMLLTLFCLGVPADHEGPTAHEGTTALGLLTDGQNLVVHPDRELTLTLEGFPTTARAGSRFEADVTVLDPAGRPVEAAVGAALVDEAVISLKDPLEITPMDHFYNPELRTVATTGSAILTWPVVSRNWGDDRHDVALPQFPYKPGGALASPAARRSTSETAAHLEEEVSSGGLIGLLGTTGSAGGSASMSEALASGSVADMAEPAAVTEVGGAPAARPAPPAITIRTELPETALWEPGLRTRDGRAALSGTLSEAIGSTQLTLVASDGRGGVGILRATVRVDQDFVVHSELPATLGQGETVEGLVTVTSRADEAFEARVRLESPGVEIAEDEVVVAVPARGQAVARFRVTGVTPGPTDLVARAWGREGSDGEQTALFVTPAGQPSVSRIADALTAEEPFLAGLAIDGRSQWADATLGVVFPAVAGDFQGLAERLDRMDEQPLQEQAIDLVTALLVLERMRERGHENAEKWTPALAQAVASLQRAQRPDGAWGPWWHDGASPWHTGYVLEALVEARRLGFDTRDAALRRAATFLVDTLRSGSVDLTAIGWWEGDTAAVRRSVRCELLHVLARVPEEVVGKKTRRRIVRLVAAERGIEDEGSPDVLAYAHFVGAAAAVELDGFDPAAAVDRLVALRQEGHWEPSWFNAWGGNIEASVVVLQLLRQLDHDRFDPVARDAIRSLIATADAWGEWHNERGSAWALRGMALIDARPEVASSVEVRVDGAVVKRVTIDPADPYLSVAELRTLDLTRFLTPGEHRVEVRYDGALEASAVLTLRRWTGQPELATTGRAWTDRDELALGERVDLHLDLSAVAPEGPATLTIPLPASLALDPEALGERPDVRRVSTDASRLRLAVAPGAREDVRVPLVAVWRGEAALTGIRVSTLDGSEATVGWEGSLSVR